MVFVLTLFTACSAPEDISSWSATEVTEKVCRSIETLEGTAVHLVEKTTMTYSEGSDVVESERWYADGNCLYIGAQSNGIVTSGLQYNNEMFTKNSVNNVWSQSKGTASYLPFGAEEGTAQQFSEEAIASWKVVDGEYCVVYDLLPEVSEKQKYTVNRTSLYFSEKWELLRVENHAEYSMESWVDGSNTDVILDVVIEYQDTSAKKIKSRIEKAYKEANE